jgi:SNF2 family DNA or RNA helicase
MIASLWNSIITSLRPDKLYIDPEIDLDLSSETLKISVSADLNGRRIRLSHQAIRKGHGRFNGRKFRIDPREQEEFLSAIDECEQVDNWVLLCPKAHIADCLAKFRAIGAKQSPSVKAIHVHNTPLESRIFLELKDPDTLILRQKLHTADGRTFDLPHHNSVSPSEWLRQGNDFFKLPDNPIHPVSAGEKDSNGNHILRQDQIPEFIEKELPQLRRTSRVFTDPEASEIRVVPTSPELQTHVDLDEHKRQIVVRPEYRSGSLVLNHQDIKKEKRSRSYTRKGRTFHRVNWAQIDGVEKALKDSGLEEEADGTYRAPTLNLDEIINTFSKLGLLAETEVLARFKRRLFTFAGIENLELPKALLADVKVRNYQQHGYEWLAFLKKYGLPGILADEMGLGKTLQTLLTVAREREPYGRHPSLVVCPAGLVEKWADEASKFLADFQTFSYAGSNRKGFLARNASNLDLVIMSYETMTRDVEDLVGYQWRFVIADEAQRVKNPDTQRAKAIRRLRAEARVAITGTPVENRLRDLWSIFAFLAPGYLFSEGEFDRRIAKPIEERADPHARDLLIRKTHPFILRRLKKHVAKELPEKIEKTIRCELTAVQRSLYQAVVTRDLDNAVRAMGGTKLSLGNPHIFTVLTKLKQICCHPGLITGQMVGFEKGISGKFDAFTEVAQQIMEGENGEGDPCNKVLLFSQYVPMASYIQDFLISLKRQCDRIDGSVPPSSRPSICKQFNTDPSRFGMVLTLFSGGVGLDLQSANYVVLYDQWWNPAVHDQAVDRVHRIGQNRNVLIFNLITRGTLEEKIEAKLIKKKGLFDFSIEDDEMMKKEITREELLDLVQLDQ